MVLHSTPEVGEEGRRGIGVAGKDFQAGCLPAVPGVGVPLQHGDRAAAVAEQPEPQRHRLALLVRTRCQVGVVGLGQRELRKDLRLLQHVAQGVVVALVPSADADQPELRILARKLCHLDVGVHETVWRNVLHHD